MEFGSRSARRGKRARPRPALDRPPGKPPRSAMPGCRSAGGFDQTAASRAPCREATSRMPPDVLFHAKPVAIRNPGEIGLQGNVLGNVQPIAKHRAPRTPGNPHASPSIGGAGSGIVTSHPCKADAFDRDAARVLRTGVCPLGSPDDIATKESCIAIHRQSPGAGTGGGATSRGSRTLAGLTSRSRSVFARSSHPSSRKRCNSEMTSAISALASSAR